MWLNRLTGSQPSHLPQQSCYQKDTKTFVKRVTHVWGTCNFIVKHSELTIAVGSILLSSHKVLWARHRNSAVVPSVHHDFNIVNTIEILCIFTKLGSSVSPACRKRRLMGLCVGITLRNVYGVGSPTVCPTSSVRLHICVPSHIWLKYRCMWRKTPINSTQTQLIKLGKHVNNKILILEVKYQAHWRMLRMIRALRYPCWNCPPNPSSFSLSPATKPVIVLVGLSEDTWVIDKSYMHE